MLKALTHDASKYSWKEAEGFISTIDRLKYSTYGSESYKKMLLKIDPSIKRHYRHNKHHPEHYLNGIEDMALQDIVEMFCDWQAAVRRHENGSIMQSIEHNQNRFNIPVEISEIFKNTIRKNTRQTKIDKTLNPL